MDARRYYNEECYALDNCLHCPDCLAFALRFFKETSGPEDGKGGRRQVVAKFILSTVAAGSLPCPKALDAQALQPYVEELLSGAAELPICHYELGRTGKD